MTTKRLPIADVEWEDASIDQHSITRQEAEKMTPMTIRSVGMLVKRSRYRVILSLEHYVDEDTCRHTEVIPRKYIKSIRIVK